ncbi:MAG: methyltransferase [Clostridia bacterium]|nr:methyltransferase [Clostridia bacterium]
MEQSITKFEPLGNEYGLWVSGNHTFGTDAILLSNFAKATKKDKMVDLGTGCGIIPLLMLRDGNLQSAVGVDISGEAIALAQKTKEDLKLSSIDFINSDLNDLKGKLPFGCHTLVTCNPPYKANGAGLQNPNERHKVARHEIECSLEGIIKVSAKLLQTSGRLCICHRPERLCELLKLMSDNKIEPKRLRLVCQRKGEEPWLVLVEGRRCGKSGMRIEPTLYIEENGNFSDEMIKIYGSYKEAYLK